MVYTVDSTGKGDEQMATTYTILSRSAAGDFLGTVKTDSHIGAANRYARRVFGRKAFALRVTGTERMSGVFQGYVPQGNASSSIGSPFHVSDR